MLSFTLLASILALSGARVVSSGNVIYHQTMTPSWLESHASYIQEARTSTANQLTFNGGSATYGAVLKVPLISSGVIKVSTPLTVEIVVANDVSIGKSVDSDIKYGLSDGEKFVGLEACDKANYGSHAPCYGAEGVSGATISALRHEGWNTDRPSDSFYPGRFVFTLKLNERWGSCYTAHDGGLMKTVGYNNRLILSKGLTLEVYRSGRGERVGIKSIMVTIMQDDA
ncbi:uncharacterized protein [Montipora capricornis]|uniref:uncharacterized protein n=1 Tax=Montipora capricornis TaxID=246305 RepID=UPI0035F2005D